jgi:hypothetical protein
MRHSRASTTSPVGDAIVCPNIRKRTGLIVRIPRLNRKKQLHQRILLAVKHIWADFAIGTELGI